MVNINKIIQGPFLLPFEKGAGGNLSGPTFKLEKIYEGIISALPIQKANHTKNILNESWQNFWKIKNKGRINHPNTTIIENGALIHGTHYEKNKINTLLKDGIISGEFEYAGKPSFVEDAETHGCADFFVNMERRGINQYFEDISIPQKVGMLKKALPEKQYLPGKFNKNQIAFIINPNNNRQDLSYILKNSATANTLKTSPLKDMPIQFPLSGAEADRHLAVVGGVPSNLIEKIIVSPSFPEKDLKDVLEMVKSYNIDAKIFDINGNLKN